ncbi:hypothetical protein COS31_04645 [Candidatus Roizmanbacteria bacterium CG02_land_8_20_14_3_00_36_15]|uniref:Phosphohexomutase n=1 Tax=Candidatus Roizmanbacteria bacterium CG10_big_fil_rev_8_21_14_0_10_36_26 TaxID=1974851 RepID=A0A2M8KK79_9BACT|nr:MAG: hypothetical protein COS51_02060 [Candidatus Roizmanbacteria bacterium CG03_land_8_20_14_0_80_36_21]PIV37457.1 MAG: hypothetical protein COS31_04645 [Candidatus Roizmanbacteria bacterium CG02_land_8_20_14_3_00_36_15]PIY70532.1 MAG: hypothetical protein COY89_00695 [Candidatus Roizmanbacteria bacterium CG_4_10_14_0_8_um_filter_36_36]PJA52642.1 MAG: hypothetical protein CO166_04985 [Candidatus Roizmanbacteria bacterium CG_4_9_14_3_um_filter_36_11]PJE60329.1 MAG: hypothetical protein COU86
MLNTKRPYLVLPKLILQPTWGGNYILNMKGWQNNNSLKNKKIGQSYELFTQTKLLTTITSSQNKNFTPELGSPNSDKIYNQLPYKKGVEFITLEQITSFYKKIPLIKLTQSIGNSFQIHIKEGVKSNRWRSKPESWYYLEDGLITFGIKRNISLVDYKKSCQIIDEKMKQLSRMIETKKISLAAAKKNARAFIKKVYPWRFVNLHKIKKFSVVNSSLGGIHHSWEEDFEKYPLGNVLYEIQKDVMDPISTIRSFDKGKFKPNGSIREIHIQDYFKLLDTNPDHNDLEKISPEKKGNRLITNKYYCLDILEINKLKTDKTHNSFVHLFVRDGEIEVAAGEGKVLLTRGHSCFIPEIISEYIIKSINNKAVVLKTFIET